MSERIGKYNVVRQLGQGGMGRLLLAEATRAGGFVRRVVLKQVRDSTDAELGRALLEEARVQATLVHRNVVPVLDLEDHEGEHFVVLEYVEGMDFRRLKALHGPLPWRFVLYVGMEVAAALDYVHRRADRTGATLSLVHRDVSPANIMCSWEGEVKLTDFGIAQTGPAQNGVVVGNFAYIAPEQAAAQSVDCRADIYSLGVVLYESLSGSNPFALQSDRATLAAVRAGKFPPLPEKSAPEALRLLVQKMMSRDRSDRCQDAAAVREALVAIEGRLADPAPMFARFLAEVRDRDKPAWQPLQRLLEVSRGLTRRLGMAAQPSADDTVADVAAPPARRSLLLLLLSVVLLLTVGLSIVGWRAWRGRRVAVEVLPVSPVGRTIATGPAAAGANLVAPIEVPASTSKPMPDATIASTRAPSVKTGSLSVNSIPWSSLFIDDKPAGHTPHMHIALGAGHHRVRLRTRDGAERLRTVEVRAGHETKLTVLFAGP